MIVLLRDATYADMPLVMAWHSNPLIYEGFYHKGRPLVWAEHYKWWTLTTEDWKKFIVCVVEDDFERPVGIVRISHLESWCPEIGFTIGEVSLWGKGIGKKAVEAACKWLKNERYKAVHTTVRKDNLRAMNLLLDLGFNPCGQARKGEVWLQKNL